MLKTIRLPTAATAAAVLGIAMAANAADDNPLASLELRHIGPAITSGRIADFPFHPDRKDEFYVATASGKLWKTENNGITWLPLADKLPSYSFGDIELDPNDPN